MAQQLPYSVGFANVKPVMVNVSQEHGADVLWQGLALPFKVGLQQFGRQRVQIAIGRAGDGAPHRLHFV